MTKRILITGVSGFIGRNLVRYLSGRADLELTGYSRHPEIHRALFNQFNVKLTDVPASVLIRQSQFHTVIHLAGIAHDLEGSASTEDYRRVNVDETELLHSAFIQSAAEKFIFLSSIKALLSNSVVPATEEMTPSPDGAYGQSKHDAEQLILGAALVQNKLNYILRPCLVYGKGVKGNMSLLAAYASSGLPFVLGRIMNSRSLLSVDNLAFVIEGLIDKNVEPGIYHVADDESVSTTELFRMLSTTYGHKATVWNWPPKFLKAVAGILGKSQQFGKMTESLVVSNGKITATLGPMPVTLSEGIRSMLS